MILEKKFDFKNRENKIYNFWAKNNFFSVDDDYNKKKFSIVMPPPNITGKLHMGHALNLTWQDILVRFKRMCGFNVLWLPGTDHASIATEIKILKEKNISKKNITREKFLEYAQEWKEKFESEIINQIKKIGSSCDWNELNFTLDKNINRAVNFVFEDLYNKKIIYKGEKIINYCPNCMTSIADAEVKYKEDNGYLYYLKYFLKNSSDFLVVATTRPETIFGDSAIAINPSDIRYLSYINKKVIVPIVNREVKIVFDNYVDINFGTGVLKITPAHDFNDFDISQKHNLKIINIFDDEGNLNESAGEFCGLNVSLSREKIILKLEKLNLIIKKEKIKHNIGIHERCGEIIEPMVKPQWFLKMSELTKPCIKSYENHELKFFPERFGEVYLKWLNNLNDWCISRQLWWGHRIPVYYCETCGEILVNQEKILSCKKCRSKKIKQEESILDTWFSSALWPFATLGWPDKTLDYEYFYPTDLLVTGYDILFFWVIKMIFSAFEETKKLPFKNVLFNGIVRDKFGRKMSKSLDNGIDPIEIIKNFGADTLRFSLSINAGTGSDIKFNIKDLENDKNFCNKLWNASKFIIDIKKNNLENNIRSSKKNNVYDFDLDISDRFILSRANHIVLNVTQLLESYEIANALKKVHDFFWYEFCDWYIECCKIKIYLNKNKSCIWILYDVLIICLKLLHPFLPFITEEIFLNIQDKEKSIMISCWPECNNSLLDLDSENNFEFLRSIIKTIRNLRSEKNIHPSKKTFVHIILNDKKKEEKINQNKYLFGLCGINKIFLDMPENKKNMVRQITDDFDILLSLDGLIDKESNISILEKKYKKILKEIERSDKILSNKEFVKKAKKDLVELECEKLRSNKELLDKIKKEIKLNYDRRS
ncbi:MAG: valine--tRNA ligase [Clostridiales bacterium]|jgi:valyl-tRNA synthetase|nr:valine--tRNA ligase [Clostridiales bacterium]